MKKKDFIDCSEINVFVMMRFRDNNPNFTKIELTIRNTLEKYGLRARLAKDIAYSDEIWTNIVYYMQNCKYGIAVFEEIDDREYNPNISMELGFMYALDRKCLLLKDERMPRLPTDICGKIYKDFDTYRIEQSISNRLKEWCENDLGLVTLQIKSISRSELDLYISKNIDSFKFKKRKVWSDYISLVYDEIEESGEMMFILWNEKEQRLTKSYKEGIHWYGPYELNIEDQKKVRQFLNLD